MSDDDAGAAIGDGWRACRTLEFDTLKDGLRLYSCAHRPCSLDGLWNVRGLPVSQLQGVRCLPSVGEVRR